MVALAIKNTDQQYTLRPSKIIALGLNYRSHVAESAFVDVSGFTEEIPTEPVLFPKTPNVLIGPGQPIVIPRFLDDYRFSDPRVDYEAELALIINRRCKQVPPDRAMDFILGFTCFNDVSQRNLQRSDKSGWFRGKSLDTFGPVGPVIVRPQDIDDPQHLAIRCLLNGREVQSADTSQMIFSIRHIIAFVSLNFTLEEGDIISTGTPAGVGPLAPGDTVTVAIESIGELMNPVVREQ
jgi:2-keto-4-pentenoate hydratase/2-oxohepta-3-ene-1,7-dioic acid hydratase in catechol pathway